VFRSDAGMGEASGGRVTGYLSGRETEQEALVWGEKAAGVKNWIGKTSEGAWLRSYSLGGMIICRVARWSWELG